MTDHLRPWVLAGLVGLISNPTVATADSRIPLVNPSFEESSHKATPAGWHLQRPLADGVESGMDRTISRRGKASLLIRSGAPHSVTWLSEPVELAVGHLYRLQGWIRTDGAFSDPTSRYPTAVPACLTMQSFPFTNHSPAVGATRDWTPVETHFIATKKTDRVRLHLGFNGPATGSVWFDDVRLDKAEDISPYIPLESVRWFGPAYRYDDRGWIFVHIEGEAYERGFQLGQLLSEEIVAYAQKLANQQNPADPQAGWNTIRFMTEAIMLPGFENEYQIEMKGIADGAASASAKLFDRKVDLIDIACLNSVIDLGQMKSALTHNTNATSGINFLKTEDELKIKYENHKCSAFAATGSATEDGRFVFGQIFMWSGYTGIHWNVLCDVQPSKGHRFVHHTFPGGIHSGADFYISQSGLVVGETTVRQTPFNPDGVPQSNRIRKAIQYADTIDDLVAIMTLRNNGQYTNEWPFANFKDDEVGIFLLGTEKQRLWRSKNKDFPGGLTDFYWCNNNNKDIEVRKEYVVNPDNAPYDLVFRPWNRDLAFNRFFQQTRGRIDSIAGVNLLASSPINRSHACDGKITTAEMAEQLVFLAHYGKTTLREKFPGGRLIKDKPEAVPHLSLGYSTPSPLFITGKLQEWKKTAPKPAKTKATDDRESKLSKAEQNYAIEKRALWRNTVYPASRAENWLISGSAGYWLMLNEMPEKLAKAVEHMDLRMAELNLSYLYHLLKEGDLAPIEAQERYDRYIDYQIPRIKGTVALHQLRLLLGNAVFFRVMDAVYRQYQAKAITNRAFIQTAERVAKRPLGDFIRQWIARKGLPNPVVKATVEKTGRRWKVHMEVAQPSNPYHLVGVVEIAAPKSVHRFPFEIRRRRTRLSWVVDEKPTRVVFNRGHDFPVEGKSFFTLANFIDDFHHTLIVYGTSRQIEANHTLALRWQTTLADAYSEILPPIRKDAEITREELAAHDLMILGSAADNSLLIDVAARVPGLSLKKNLFVFRDQAHTRSDEGLIAVVPNPYNHKKAAYLIIANSAVQLYKMTGQWIKGIPSWALFQGDEIQSKGVHLIDRYVFDLKNRRQE